MAYVLALSILLQVALVGYMVSSFEDNLDKLTRRNQQREDDLLDRVMFATGKTWKRPDPEQEIKKVEEINKAAATVHQWRDF